MKIPVSKRLIDSVEHSHSIGEKKENKPDFYHFPCLTERAIYDATGGKRVWVQSFGVVMNAEPPYNNLGTVDSVGEDYQRAYDSHAFDTIKPGSFEFIENPTTI